jgi:glycosyltransferase involved in cell wall biosynthesis
MNNSISLHFNYKRAHLIGETLDSVLASKGKLECIIVDDGSVDHTDKIVLGCVNEDSRFQYQRPTGQPKGANACRKWF